MLRVGPGVRTSAWFIAGIGGASDVITASGPVARAGRAPFPEVHTGESSAAVCQDDRLSQTARVPASGGWLLQTRAFATAPLKLRSWKRKMSRVCWESLGVVEVSVHAAIGFQDKRQTL